MRTLRSISAALGMLLILLSCYGCGSEEEFMTSINTSHLYFEGRSASKTSISCQFDLQTVYFHTQPLHLILKANIKNESEQSLELSGEKDSLDIVISDKVKYKTPLENHEGYSQVLGSGEVYESTLTLNTQSLIRYARNLKIKALEYSIADAPTQCVAQLSRKIESE